MTIDYKTAIKIKEHYKPLLNKKEFNHHNSRFVVIELILIPNDAEKVNRGGHNQPDKYVPGNNMGVYVVYSPHDLYNPFVSTIEEILPLAGISSDFLTSTLTLNN